MSDLRDRAGLPASPCRRICRQNAEAGFCEGCGRTVMEVVRWNSLDAEERAEITAQLPARLKRLTG